MALADGVRRCSLNFGHRFSFSRVPRRGQTSSFGDFFFGRPLTDREEKRSLSLLVGFGRRGHRRCVFSRGKRRVFAPRYCARSHNGSKSSVARERPSRDGKMSRGEERGRHIYFDERQSAKGRTAAIVVSHPTLLEKIRGHAFFQGTSVHWRLFP